MPRRYTGLRSAVTLACANNCAFSSVLPVCRPQSSGLCRLTNTPAARDVPFRHAERGSLDKGADASAQDSDGQTPLHKAAAQVRVRACRVRAHAMLPRLGSVMWGRPLTACMMHPQQGHAATVTCLLAACPSASQVADTRGRTPADMASSPEVAAALVQAQP